MRTSFFRKRREVTGKQCTTFWQRWNPQLRPLCSTEKGELPNRGSPSDLSIHQKGSSSLPATCSPTSPQSISNPLQNSRPQLHFPLLIGWLRCNVCNKYVFRGRVCVAESFMSEQTSFRPSIVGVSGPRIVDLRGTCFLSGIRALPFPILSLTLGTCTVWAPAEGNCPRVSVRSSFL